MTRVCVVGGGTAGSEAAVEATTRGAEVTVVELAETPGPPWRSWLDFLRPQPPPPSAVRGCLHWSVITAVAKSVGPGFVTTSDGRRVNADSVVMATGCGFELVSFPGVRKQGVVVLDKIGAYSELKRVVQGSEDVVICGEGRRALQVAETLEGGRRVHVLPSSWQVGEPGPAAMAAIRGACRTYGVDFLDGPLSKAVGLKSLEAVVAAGEVVRCDTLVVVPRRVPRVVQAVVSLGRRGGYLVDPTLSSDCKSVYAAGGCAELQTAHGLPRTFENEARKTGRVAGANCTGENISVGMLQMECESFFGLTWSRASIGRSRESPGPSLETTTSRRADLAVCSISYERTSGRVAMVELVEEAASDLTGSPNFFPTPTLRSLAYGTLGGSSDISLVSDTARLELAKWHGF